MIKKLIPCLILILLLTITLKVKAQQKPAFYNDILAFKKQDSISAPPQNAILFVGSSTFTNWKDVQTYFPEHTIINRGFGGSTFVDIIRYAPDVIYPYKPKQILIYCGDNDLASSDSITPQIVFDRFKQLHGMIRENLGKEVDITFVSIKPSPSRKRLMPKMEETNGLVKTFAKKNRNVSFIDTYHPMLESKSYPKEIFRDDSLHMNANGYAIWKKVMEPYLHK